MSQLRTWVWYDVGFLLGLVLVAVGLAMWSRPLALIVTGLELVAVCLLAALRARSAPSPSLQRPHGTPDDATA